MHCMSRSSKPIWGQSFVADPVSNCLWQAARNPEGEKLEAWQDWLRRYRAKLRAEGLSDEERRTMQNAANPAYIPRNQLMQRAITAAEDGDLGPVGGSSA